MKISSNGRFRKPRRNVSSVLSEQRCYQQIQIFNQTLVYSRHKNKQAFIISFLDTPASLSIYKSASTLHHIHTDDSAMHVDVRLLLVLLLLLFDVVAGDCPAYPPCHCIGDRFVDCALKRLHEIPQFSVFQHTWRELNLSDNLVTSIPDSVFAKVHVYTLDLSSNMIKTMNKYGFRSATHIVTLDLSHNIIEYLPDHVFSSMTNLKTLRLRYNKLYYIKPNVLIKLKQLYELDLRGNSFNKIPSKSLRHLTSLKRLILRDNRLKELESFTFQGLVLEYLDLGDNIAPFQISKTSFCGLDPRVVHSEPSVIEWSGLQTLLLDHNGLSSMNPCLSSVLWTLRHIDLSGNPLRCDCRLFLLRDFKSRISLKGSQCAVPWRYGGEYLDLIPESRYNCSEEHHLVNECESLCPPIVLPNTATQHRTLSLFMCILFICRWVLVLTTST